MTNDTTQPVAMFRGIYPTWTLYNAERHPLAVFFGSYIKAWEEGKKWCHENGYHLSRWSDADDRMAGTP